MISYVISYVILEQTFSFSSSSSLSGCRLPAAFLGLLCPFSCLADTILPGSLRLLDGHHPGLSPSVAPQPKIHLVQSAAVPAIRLGICGCSTKDSAVLEFVGNRWMGVTSGGRPVQTFSKVCMSLQSLRLGDFLQTFCRLFFMKCTLCADFLQTFSMDQLLPCTLFAHFLHTFCSK